MARNSDLAGDMQPNNSEYQGATGQPGMVQSTQNARDAHTAEYTACNILGAGWAAIGSPEQAVGNPPGVGPLPTGATPLRSGRTPIRRG